jgi:hypothetical protein
MNITQINIGDIANDGTGDDLRTAFDIINHNFVEVETSIDASTVAANLGAGVGVFKQKTVNTLEFKSLAVDDKLAIAADGNTITISTNFENKTLRIGGIEVIGNNNNGTSTVIGQNSVTSGMFNGTVNGNLIGGRVYPLAPDYIIGDGNINGVQPNPGLPNYRPARVDGVSVRDLSSTINTFDFGNLGGVYTSAIPYMLSQIGLDMGTITSPADVSVDAGTI